MRAAAVAAVFVFVALGKFVVVVSGIPIDDDDGGGCFCCCSWMLGGVGWLIDARGGNHCCRIAVVYRLLYSGCGGGRWYGHGGGAAGGDSGVGVGEGGHTEGLLPPLQQRGSLVLLLSVWDGQQVVRHSSLCVFGHAGNVPLPERSIATFQV